MRRQVSDAAIVAALAAVLDAVRETGGEMTMLARQGDGRVIARFTLAPGDSVDLIPMLIYEWTRDAAPQ